MPAAFAVTGHPTEHRQEDLEVDYAVSPAREH